MRRGDIHGLAIACGNIGFLKFYNPEEFDDSVVYQFIEYSLAEQVGDFARMGIAFNKIGKLYTALGFNEEAEEMFKIAIDGARRADNIAGEGMAWGNLGTVYRALERFKDAIDCHVKYRDNAERRMDIGGVAIMQHQLAMDYILSGKLPEAERSVLDAFQTLERIRSQVGGEDKSKLSNFEKNQAEAYNLLQVVLVAQGKFKEALVLADASRGRALAEIVRKRLSGCSDISSGEETVTLNEEFIAESFNNLVEISRKRSTTLVFYSVVKEFDQSGAYFTWVYTWVLCPSGSLNFNKTRLQHDLETKVEVNDEFIVSLRRSMGQQSQMGTVGEILRSCAEQDKVSREAKIPVATLKGEDVLSSLKGFEHEFITGWQSIGISLKTKDQGTQEHMMVLKESSISNEERTFDESTCNQEGWLVKKTVAEISTASKTELCSVESSESYEVSSEEEVHSSGSMKQSSVIKHSVTFDEPDNISGKSSLIVECPEEDLQDNVKTQSKLEKDKSSFEASEESLHHPISDSVFAHSCTHLESDTAKSEVLIASKAGDNPIKEEADKPCLMTTSQNGLGENPAKVEENESFPLATSEENLQHSLSGSELSHSCTHLESGQAKSEILAASKPSDNPFEEEADKPSLTVPSHDGSGATAEGLEHGIASKPSCEESNFSLQSDNNIEGKYGDQLHEFPKKDDDHVSVGNSSGPFYEVETEPLGAHSKVHKNEPQSDPELDPWTPMLSQLHKILIEPIMDFLPKNDESQRVTFIPQDFLLKVPFAALQNEARGHYFMEDFIISTSPAIHFLDLACTSRETSLKTTTLLELSLLAVGNPIMPFEELPQLPSAEYEVRMIREILKSPMSEILIGSQAQKAVVIEAMPKYRVLHFATHAIIDDSDSHGDFSMRGLIVLTKSGLECDGILTAEEVRGLELNAELVVLSCCESGLGKVTGDGMLGELKTFL